MTPDLIELGKRAVACKRWRWMGGMFDPVEERWITRSIYPGTIPDLSDPATLGCLLALVREAYGDPSLYVRLSDTTRVSDGARAWEVLGWFDAAWSPDGRAGTWRGWGYASEAEALVAALEAAP